MASSTRRHPSGGPPPPSADPFVPVEAPPTSWHARGARLRGVDGVAVFVRTEGDLRASVPLLLLHGFPTSSFDYAGVWERLGQRRPLITLDFVGFGLSDKPASYGYALADHADVVLQVLRALGVEAAHVCAHDMATSVLLELLARRERGLLPVELRSVTFSNGSVFLEMAHLTLAQRLLRRGRLGPPFARASGYSLFRRSLRRLYVEPDAIDESELRLAFQLLCRAEGKSRLPQLTSYQDDRVRFARRHRGALERLDLPSLVLWGARDPVAVLPIGERLAREIPGARLRVLAGVGHFPQVEAPDAYAAELDAFLEELAASR